MRSSSTKLERTAASTLLLLFASPFAGAAPQPLVLQAAATAQETSSAQTSPAALPRTPQASTAAQNAQPEPGESTQQREQKAPLGTAAAPVIRSGGVPASRPAGAAIAPAKQRRARSYAIRVGLIVGAAVAVGAVTAASLSSPSRPH